MKNLFLFVFFCVLSHLLNASDFEKIDAVLTETTRVKSITAKRKEAWIEEKNRMLSLEKSYEALLQAKRDNIERLKKEISKIQTSDTNLTQKLSSDSNALKKFSTELDSAISVLKNNEKIAKILKEESVNLNGFEAKSALEKFALLAQAYSKLMEVSSRIERNEDNVSTGIFPNATGKEKDGIAVLHVDRKAVK